MKSLTLSLIALALSTLILVNLLVRKTTPKALAGWEAMLADLQRRIAAAR